MKVISSRRFLWALSLLSLMSVAALTITIGIVLIRHGATFGGSLSAALAVLVGAVVFVAPMVLLAARQYHRASSAALKTD